MKNIWIVANWKSNKTIQESLEWISEVAPKLPREENLKIVVCPTFVAIEEVKKEIQVGNFPLLVGSQDISSYDVGAHTGEEAAKILKELVNIAIIGHSERRQMGETDEIVAQKVQKALEYDIIPIVCVQGKDTLIPQGVSIIAYEPVFAIGTGNPDTPQNANNIAAFLKQKYGDHLKVLYGGSVTSENVKAFVQQENINGVLVGKASLMTQEFVKIINECQAI